MGKSDGGVVSALMSLAGVETLRSFSIKINKHLCEKKKIIPDGFSSYSSL